MLFLNHSCQPNVGFAGNIVLGTIDGRDWRRPDLRQRHGPYFSWYLRRRFDPTAGP